SRSVMSKRRVVVTGGCGFVGSSLVGRLVAAEDSDVTVLDDCSLGVPENLGEARGEVTLAQVDVCDRDAVVRALGEIEPEVIFHLAPLHSISACDSDPKRCVDVNVGGTQAVLDGAHAAGAKAVVVASTAAVYAPGEDAHGDDGTVGPIDIYGLSKLWAEQLTEL